ncbi:MAG: hypothetical protein ABJB47_22250 [Actinomycetota bacterium]
MMRTNPCTPDIRRGRLLKAGRFLEAAELLADQPGGQAENSDAYITLCISAGIAASDVICCARFGRHAQGQDHNAAVTLLGQADSESAKHLRVLLSMKTKASYRHTGSSADDAKRAGRAAEALVEAARRMNAG